MDSRPPVDVNRKAGKAVPAVVGYIAAALAGAAVWVWMASGLGREGWDNPAYLSVAYPLLGLAVGLLGFFTCAHPVLLGFVAMGAQAAIMLLGGLGNLWPLGLMMMGALSLPLMLTAGLGWILQRALVRLRDKVG